MATNVPLQQRAGRNIGIESVPVFLQAAGAPEVEVPTNSVATTLLEAVENALRTPFTRAEDGNGYLFSTEAVDVNFVVIFRDSLGNEMAIASGTVGAGASGPLDLTQPGPVPFDPDEPLSLFAGEKIIIRVAPVVA